MTIEDVAFRVVIAIAHIVKWAFLAGLIVIAGLLFVGPIGWIKMGLLVECKYVESCAKEHNIEYVERKSEQGQCKGIPAAGAGAGRWEGDSV